MLISLIFLWLSIRKIDLNELKLALAHVNYIYTIPAVLLTLFTYFFRSIRWKYLLRSVQDVSLYHLYSATMIGVMANYLLPARLGEFVRAYVIGEKASVRKSSAFATILIERILDGLVILLYLVILLFLMDYPFPDWLRSAFYISAGVYMFGLVFLLMFSIYPEFILKGLCRLFSPLPENIYLKISRILESFTHGLSFFKSKKDLWISSLLSLVVWIPWGFVIYIMFFSVGLKLPILVAFFLLTILCIGIMIPSAPGFIGIVQFIFVAGLGLFEVPRAQALGYSFIYHLTQYVPLVSVGLFFLFKEGFSFSQISRSTDKMQSISKTAQ